MGHYNNCAILAVIILVIQTLLLAQKVYGELYDLGDFGETPKLKIECSSGTTADFVSDCPLNDKCSSLKISENHTLRCIPSLPLDNLYSK